jgi:CheY-like chemotaxis protein/anti-sigma regulatory factor (Ser/Thr protein kinase)
MLLDGLLDMSSLDTGVVRPDIQVFALEPLLSCLNVEFSALARERGLTLRTVTSHCHVRSDQQLLRRVLQNYLSNALRYTPAGRILLGCRRRGGTLRIMVRDTGIGIPEDKQQEIFQEFRRLDSRAAGGQDRGLGLGLAIVDRISRLLNQEITLSSTPGRGASFAIDVPVAPQPAARLAVSSGWASGHEQSGRLILCIDNETTILQGMDAVLSQWGYRVLTAADGAQALELLGGAVPDTVLIDYHLDGRRPASRCSMLRQRWQRFEALQTADRARACCKRRRAIRECCISRLSRLAAPFLTAAARRPAPGRRTPAVG